MLNWNKLHTTSATSVPVVCPQLNRLFSSISEVSWQLDIEVARVQYASITGCAINGYTFERRK